MKVELSRLIPRKLTENLDLFAGLFFCQFLMFTYSQHTFPSFFLPNCINPFPITSLVFIYQFLRLCFQRLPFKGPP